MNKILLHVLRVSCLALLCLPPAAGRAAQAGIFVGTTVRVSLAIDGAEGTESSNHPLISADGRFVAFMSAADNLVPGDLNEKVDIFVRDLQTGGLERITIGPLDAEADGDSELEGITPDGRFVVFSSEAANLIYGDGNGSDDVFVRDRQAGVTERVSLSTNEVEGNHSSSSAAISADGRFVAFESSADNLIAGDTNNRPDIFVRDRSEGTTTRVSLAHNESQAIGRSFDPDISADGRYVVFSSDAANLVARDTNEQTDIFRRDRTAGATVRVSVSSDGAQSDAPATAAVISADGQKVAFNSNASTLDINDTNQQMDIFVRNIPAAQTRRISMNTDGVEADHNSTRPAISADGRWVSFCSAATNLVAGDLNGHEDVFLHDLQTGETMRVSINTWGAEGRLNSTSSSVSSGGRLVAFDSGSTLAPNDLNRRMDVYVHDREGMVQAVFLPYVKMP